MKAYDSLVNFISGLGTSRDKSAYNQYSMRDLSVSQIDQAYRGEWLPRKIIDIPANDATREWRSWQADNAQISAIESVESSIAVQDKIRQAMTVSRLYGGAVIIIGVDGAGEWSDPLRIDQVRPRSLKFLHVMDRHEVGIGSVNNDITSGRFGEPDYYTAPGSSLVIHPSRVIRFVPRPLPSRRMGVDGWGDSVILSINDAVMQALASSSALSTLIQEASIDVIKIPDMMMSIGTSEYRGRLIERMQLAQTGKSIVRSLLLDKDEDWQRHTTNFANLPEVVRLMLSIASGAADIPVTRLLGESPGGLNATGDSDTRNYYDSVASTQKNIIQPAISTLDEVIIRSALGERPESIYYNWRPLWQMSQSEAAEVRLKNSQSLVNVYNTGLVPNDALSTGAINMLIEDGLLPGLEQAVEGSDIDESSSHVREQFNGL